MSGFSWLDSGYAGVSFMCVLLRMSYLEAHDVHPFLSTEVNFDLDMVLLLYSSCPCNWWAICGEALWDYENILLLIKISPEVRIHWSILVYINLSSDGFKIIFQHENFQTFATMISMASDLLAGTRYPAVSKSFSFSSTYLFTYLCVYLFRHLHIYYWCVLIDFYSFNGFSFITALHYFSAQIVVRAFSSCSCVFVPHHFLSTCFLATPNLWLFKKS